jgi:ABC-2 type transport system permease protein
MQTILTIARYEYGRHVRRRGFLFAALGVPLLMVAIFGVIGLVVTRSGLEQRLGLVDPTGDFAAVDVNTLDLSRTIPTDTFADEAAAHAAFEAGTIDAYVVVADDYVATGQVRAVGHRRLSERAQTQLRAILRQGLLADVPEANRARLLVPDDLVLRTLQGGREVGADNALLFFLPYGFALLFVMTTFTTSGYLLQAVAEEKEDRVGEIMAVTVTPRQMMTGKILGLSGVGLTQTFAWVTLAAIATLIFVGNFAWLAGLQLPWSFLALAIVYFLLGYLLIAACYACAGAAVPTPQEAQPLVTPVSLLAVAPMFVITVILSRPNGLLAVILSMIPFSAPMTMLMRLPLADIPAWQLVASLLLLGMSAIGAMFLSGRVFRLGLLRYGKRLSLREMFGAPAR